MPPKSESFHSPAPHSMFSKSWIIGMLAGEVAGFKAALFLTPSITVQAVALSVVALSTVAGGVMGVKVASSLRRLQKASMPVVEPKFMEQYVFEALRTDEKNFDDMYIEEEFNTVAANGNEPQQKKEPAPALKVANAPSAPRMM